MVPAKLRCVVIDDDQDFRQKIERWFATSCPEFEVLPFSNGLDAAEYLRQQRVDVIVTAYLMPQIDGLQLISLIRSIDAQVPIYMTSGVPIQAAALGRGATGFFPKASLWSQLEAIIAKVRAPATPLAA